MRATRRRWALEELEAIGQEDADEWPDLDVEQSLHLGAVGAHPLHRLERWPAPLRRGQTPARLGRGKAHAQLVRARGVREADDDAGGVGAEAHELALVAGARRAPGAAVVERLEQVRLARAVGPVHD